MRSLKELRALAGELHEKGIRPPYFLQVNEEEISGLEKLTGSVSAAEYGPAAEQPPCGFYDIGACEYFQFVVADRRKQDRRKK